MALGAVIEDAPSKQSDHLSDRKKRTVQSQKKEVMTASKLFSLNLQPKR